MPIDISNSDEFHRLLDGLGRDVVAAAIHFRLHRDLYAAVPDFEREFNQSMAFWSLTFNAHLEVARLCILRAYDQHQRSLSLGSLLETIRDNSNIFSANRPASGIVADGATPPQPSKLDKDLALVADSDPLVKKLTVLRNNLYAHRNAANTVRELRIEQEYPLSYEELQCLVDRAFTILNRYSILFRRSSWSTSIVGHDDYKYVLESVRQSIELHDQSINDELRRSDEAVD